MLMMCVFYGKDHGDASAIFKYSETHPTTQTSARIGSMSCYNITCDVFIIMLSVHRVKQLHTEIHSQCVIGV